MKQIGKYNYVVPTEVLRPLRERTLYCLFYATRHESGLAAFRECQTKALDAQAATRAALKLKQDANASGQSELFTSLHDMGPNETAALRATAKKAAEGAVLQLCPGHQISSIQEAVGRGANQACCQAHRRECHLRRTQKNEQACVPGLGAARACAENSAASPAATLSHPSPGCPGRHCHGNRMARAAVRRSQVGGSSRGRVLPLLCGVGPEQTHDAAGEEVALEKVCEPRYAR